MNDQTRHVLRGRPVPRQEILLAGVCALLAVAVYLNALHNPFVYDDQFEVLENPSVEHLTSPALILRANLTRPIVNFSYALDYATWGGRNVFGYHVTNLLLHVANVILLFALVSGLARDRQRLLFGPDATAPPLLAFTAAALLAVHPLMTEAVGYVSSRSELLCGSFFIGSLLCFRHAPLLSRSHPPVSRSHPLTVSGSYTLSSWQLWGTVLFVLALASKEIGAMLPFVLLGYDIIVLDPEDRKLRFWRLHAPLLTVVLLGAGVRLWLYMAVEHADAQQFQWQYGLVVLHVVARYVELLFFPVSQSLIPAVDPITSLFQRGAITTAVVFALLGAAAVMARKREPLVTFGLIWFLLLLVPSSVLILLADRGQPMAEHRVYLASCGVFLAVGVVTERFAAAASRAADRWKSLIVPAAVAVLLAVFSVLTVSRNRVWADPVVLWTDAVQKAPRTWTAYNGLAETYRSARNYKAAVETFQRAIALRPELVYGYLGLAGTLLEAGQLERAAEALRLGIMRVPSDTQARLRLADVEENGFRDPAAAVRLCREVLDIQPTNTKAQDCVRRNQQRMPARR